MMVGSAVALGIGVAVAGSLWGVGTGVAIPITEETQLVSKTAARLNAVMILDEARCINGLLFHFL
jgi:hypothetical protein